jgi:ABC-type branched-subunit amino acid transport system substrate-binding protein
MHRPLTWFAGIGGAVLMLLAACSGGSDRTPSEPSTIKIGVIIPTRGQSASLAASFEKAVRVSVDTLPATTKHRYQLVVADAGDGTEEDSKRAARQLVDEHKVAAIVGGISKVGEHVAPIATEAKVPHICICSIPTIGDGRYNYTNIPLAEDEAEAWVAEAKARGLRTIAILAQKYASVDGHVNALKVAASAAGMQVVDEYRFPAGTTDFLKPMMAAGATNPDVYFVSAYEPSLTALGKQIQVAEKVHSKDLNVASIVAISLAPDLRIFEGAWYTDSDLPRPEVFEQFLKAFPASELITHMMPYAYDSIRIFVDGIESDEGLVSYLQKLTRYNGSNGLITREPGSGNFRSTPVVWVVKDGCAEVQATGRTRPGCAPASDPDADASQPANPHAPTTNASQPANPHAPSTNAN